jgi:hypothetical protein
MDLQEVVNDLGQTRRNRYKKWNSFMVKYNCDVICEIGVQIGTNFNRMIQHNPSLAVAVDCWIDDNVISHNDGGFPQELLNQQFNDFIKSVSGKPFVKVIRDYSYNAAKEFPSDFFDLVYLDGDHTYEGCLRDIEDWYPKVKKGKFLVGDDFRNDEGRLRFKKDIKLKFGVIDAVTKFSQKNNIQFYELPYLGWAIIKK